MPPLQTLPMCPQARTYIQSLPPMPQKDLRSIFRGANPLGEDGPGSWLGAASGPGCGADLHPLLPWRHAAVDLLGRMLVLDSDQRLSAAQALAHAYFSQYHDPEDEPEAEPYDESVEAKERTLEEWKGGPGRGEGNRAGGARGLRAAFPGGWALPVCCRRASTHPRGGLGRDNTYPSNSRRAVRDRVGTSSRAGGSTEQALEWPWAEAVLRWWLA